MDFDALWDAFEALQTDTMLNDESNIYGRAEALDTLTFIEDEARNKNASPEATVLTGAVSQLREHLESINTRVFSEVWENLRMHTTTPASLRELLNQYTSYSPGTGGYNHFDYEALDVLISGTFFAAKVPTPLMPLNPGMLPWEASPGSVILDMVDHLPFQSDDVFFDLGSGLGSVTLLVNYLTGIQTVGIEREPVYYEYARELAQTLSLSQVTFTNADVRNADLSEGTIFYLFTPFLASILDIVMAKLHNVAQHHPIYVCSFGPCTPTIAQVPWLDIISGDGDHEFMLAIFRADESVF